MTERAFRATTTKFCWSLQYSKMVLTAVCHRCHA